MKRGTQYAKKVKKAYEKFQGIAGNVETPEALAPIDQLVLAVFAEATSHASAAAALQQLRAEMVDMNEVRVSTAAEIALAVGKHIPDGVDCAQRLIRLLNAIFEKEYAVSLDVLSSMGIRDIKSYLEALDGITPYITASVLLWSLGGHAIPVSGNVMAFLKDQDLVDSEATSSEVQAFLERHISASDAKGFCLDLEVYAASAESKEKSESTSKGGKKTAKKKTASKKSKAKTKSASKKKTASEKQS